MAIRAHLMNKTVTYGATRFNGDTQDKLRDFLEENGVQVFCTENESSTDVQEWEMDKSDLSRLITEVKNGHIEWPFTDRSVCETLTEKDETLDYLQKCIDASTDASVCWLSWF